MDREGMLLICKLVNISISGLMPVEKLKPVAAAYYRKRTVGYNRLYAAMGANQEISMLVRCFNTEVPSYTGQLYVVFPDDERENQFRVSAIQEIVEEGAIDLTLTRLEAFYDVNTE